MLARGAFIRVQACEQGIRTWLQKLARPAPSKVRGSPGPHDAEAGSPPKVECMALRPGPASPHPGPGPGQATRHPRWGSRPDPRGLGPGLKHHVSGRITINAPFRVVGPFSALIRRRTLALVGAEAERKR
jgi:hypothetical protein